MSVYAYFRVSVEELTVVDMSIEFQRQQVQGYAMLRGWSLQSSFSDIGVSGSEPFARRSEGRKLLNVIKGGDVIVASHLGRAFEDASDAVEIIRRLKAQGIALYLMDLGGDVAGSGISKMVLTILTAVSEKDSKIKLRSSVKPRKPRLQIKLDDVAGSSMTTAS